MNLLGASSCEGHSDGWGYVLIGILEGGEEVVDYYRSTRPVYEDTYALSKLKESTRGIAFGVLVAHSRRRAEGSIRIGNTHPLHYSWRYFDMWIAHNGVVDAEAIARDLGLPRAEDTTDTYYLGEFVYRSIGDLSLNEIVKKLREASKYTKTAMNTSILFYTRGRAIFVVTSYLNPGRLGSPKVIDYYKLYLLQSPGTSVALSSSILKYFSILSEGVSEIPLQSGLAVELNLRERSEVERISFKLGT